MRDSFFKPLTLTLTMLGCGPSEGNEPKGDEAERYAEKICDAIAVCGCYEFFASAQACETEYSGRFRTLANAGLQLNPDCFEEVMDTDDDLADCAREEEAPEDWRCTVLRGSKKLGQACS